MSSTTSFNLSLSNYHKLYALTLQNVQKLMLFSIHLFIYVLHYASALSKVVFIRNLSSSIKNAERSKIIENAKKLEKSPKHLLIVIQENEISLNEVADIVIWSLFSGIPFITLSDKNGYLKKNYTSLQEKYETKLQLICNKDKLPYPVTQFHTEKYFEHSNASFNVIITSTSASRCSLINSMKSLSNEMVNNVGLKQKFDSNAIDFKLKERGGVAIEPDLAITFGPYLSYFGFQPWNMRLTEFITLSTHRNVTYEKFFHALVKFARCQQRHGT